MSTVTTVAFNLLLGACQILRRQALRQCGIHLGDEYFDERPLTRDEIERRLR